MKISRIPLAFFDASSIIDSMIEMTRKQREIERRTGEILRVAKPILVGEGFQALSMDRVAAKMEYAKGTIYNHFPHKEEIVLALAIQAMDLRRKLFECSAASGSDSRDRMMAIGVACEFYTHHCHEEFVIEQWMRTHSVWEKSSQQRQNLIRQCEGQCMAIVTGIVRDAIRDGDLTVPVDMTHEEFVFGFWALTFGNQILIASSPSLPALGIHNPARAIRIHCATLLNGFGWQPTTDLHGYIQRAEQLTAALTPQLHLLRREHLTASY
jgi:AcrR family transcriptional regulator